MAQDERMRTIAGWRVDNTPAPLMYVPNAATSVAHRALAAELFKAAMAATTTKIERQAKEGWQLKRIKDVLLTIFLPDGRVPSNLTDKAVQARLVPVFEKNGWKLPSIDSIARARGRRDRRG
jgi:hypothetical protein